MCRLIYGENGLYIHEESRQQGRRQLKQGAKGVIDRVGERVKMVSWRCTGSRLQFLCMEWPEWHAFI